MLYSYITKTLLSITNNIKNIHQLQLEYWFGSLESLKIQIVLPYFIYFSLSFLFGATLYLYDRVKVGYYPPKNRFFKPFSIGLMIFGVTGALFSLLRILRVSFLGTRFFLFTFILIVAAWGLYFFFKWRKSLPKDIIDYETSLIKKKFLSKIAKR
ncbi:MAG: hypothetical protein A2172_01570 [Candidatus Woykebacteria bacterium RBG_13_40_15]|uniref:Uncharacterized protein n=1 Tax=Candidatus Woykebacteria bacterium RBG_13_40_15 TaxID=1802593 RepID=A0A1G1W569_9BACT|nr:MAG: hypothetical protein A2172_01570 [Candidatus Woykebacteria bacterium RBG_13_40_15]